MHQATPSNPINISPSNKDSASIQSTLSNSFSPPPSNHGQLSIQSSFASPPIDKVPSSPSDEDPSIHSLSTNLNPSRGTYQEMLNEVRNVCRKVVPGNTPGNQKLGGAEGELLKSSVGLTKTKTSYIHFLMDGSRSFLTFGWT